ncbi:hypothetical protein HQ576_11005 [bacterium]|nr:hypothetical protein [bacterium]
MFARHIAITGIGCISPLGVHLDALADALAAGRSGVGEVASFDAAAYSCHVGAEVLDLELADFLESSKTYIDRTSAFALAACSDALRQAEWLGDESVGLVLGTAWGCMDSLEVFAGKYATGKRKFVAPLPFSHSYANAPNSLAAIEFKLRGFNACMAGGHAAGATAIEYACRRLRLGKDARLLAGGSEALSECIFHAYALGGHLSAAGVSRPYDAAADGMILGEGAAVFALESLAAARERGAEVLACIGGCGAACGATIADGLERAMRLALDDAGAEAATVDMVMGIGCGVPSLDGAERAAVDAVFGPSTPPLASLKALAGEAMGAGGPLSMAAAVCMLADGVPPAALAVGAPPDAVRAVLVNAADPSGQAVSFLLSTEVS